MAFFFLFFDVGDQGLGSKNHTGNRSGVLQGASGHFDRPEALAAVANGDADTWLTSLTGTLAQPEIAAKSPKMLIAYRERVKELVENLRNNSEYRNADRIIKTLIKAKLNGLV